VIATEIAEVKMIFPKIHRRERGFIPGTYSRAHPTALGTNLEFVQDNYPLSVERGVVCELHSHIPFGPGKLTAVRSQE